MSFTRIASAAVAVQVLLLTLSGGAQAQSPASSGAGGCAGAAQVPSDAPTRRASVATVLCLVNAERAERALLPVAASALLTKAATSHSGDMVRRQYFAHVSPGGMDLRRRVLRTGYMRDNPRAVLGETIAWGVAGWSTPSELVADLMRSPPHRAIVLDGRFRDVGVGLTLGSPMDALGGVASTLSMTFGRR